MLDWRAIRCLPTCYIQVWVVLSQLVVYMVHLYLEMGESNLVGCSVIHLRHLVYLSI